MRKLAPARVSYQDDGAKVAPVSCKQKYHRRNKSAHRPEIKTDRFRNIFVNRLVFRYNL